MHINGSLHGEASRDGFIVSGSQVDSEEAGGDDCCCQLLVGSPSPPSSSFPSHPPLDVSQIPLLWIDYLSPMSMLEV